MQRDAGRVQLQPVLLQPDQLISDGQLLLLRLSFLSLQKGLLLLQLRDRVQSETRRIRNVFWTLQRLNILIKMSDIRVFQDILMKHPYLEDVGIKVSFILGQAFIHAAHLGQRVSESCILRLELVEQQRKLCVTALSLEGR